MYKALSIFFSFVVLDQRPSIIGSDLKNSTQSRDLTGYLSCDICQGVSNAI